MNADQVVKVLTIENHELRTENGRLRHRLREASYHARRVEQAYRDALQLALWASAGIHPARQFAARHGMTQSRWENATALLRQARVLLGHRRWSTTDAAAIEGRLERVRQAATEAKDAYQARHVRDRRH